MSESPKSESTVSQAALLPSLFLDRATRFPDRIAIDVPPSSRRPERVTWTYDELRRRAVAVASEVRRRAPAEGDAVAALLVPRSDPNLYAAQLGAWLAGVAYQSLDPQLPDDRLRFLLEDTRPRVVLASAGELDRLRALGHDGASVLDLDGCAPGSGDEPTLPSPTISGRELAYVIHTSGSTGRPKGVLIEHRSIAHLIATDRERFELQPEDRVAQGSSPTYDSSVEEIWLAWSAGAAVVVMDDEAARLGPDLVGWLRDERITVLCPPPTLLRSMVCDDPERALPDLRLLYVGGEALPRDVADRWGVGRHLENGYGPTECTVTVMRTRIEPGGPITIGTPIPGHRAYVLDEALRAVAPGEIGELCIAGPGVARGYLDRPDENALRFIEHPEYGRLYRTGDLASRDPASENFHYHGRADRQVKVRGHRIELEEIESRLVEHEAVREAACVVEGGDRLVAWVVPVQRERSIREEALRAWVAASLPDVMVPDRFGELDALPRTAGDKLDRSALPASGPSATPRSAEDEPADDLERWIEAVVREQLGAREPVSVRAHFFEELGGNSLIAAMVVSRLREDSRTERLAVRDLYRTPTIRGLAGGARSGGVDSFAAVPHERVAPLATGGRPWVATAVQVAWLLLVLVVSGPIVAALVFVGIPKLIDTLGGFGSLLVAPVLVGVAALLGLGASVALTRAMQMLLLGPSVARREPAFGSFHARLWIVRWCARTIPWGVVSGTVFQSWVLRALGARVGRRVHLHRGVDLTHGCWDLLTIGDDVSVGSDAALRWVDLDRGAVVTGPIVIESGVTVETRAGLGPGSTVRKNGTLAPLSALTTGAEVPEGERWSGIPARPSGKSAAPAKLGAESKWSPAVHGAATIALRVGIGGFHSLPMLATAIAAALGFGIDGPEVASWLAAPSWSTPLAATSVAIACAMVPLQLTLAAWTCRLLGAVPPGTVSRWSPRYLRIWAKSGVVERAGNWLSGTLFWPVWLRAAGMQIGPRCEISTITDVIPEQVEVGDESFFADGIYLGGPRVHRGTVTVGRTVVGSDSFFGNHVVIPTGTALPDRVLFGVCTVAADVATMTADSAWFGDPPFRLPRREVVELDRRTTHDPTWIRRLNRRFWETLRVVLPAIPLLGAFLWFAGVGATVPRLGDLSLERLDAWLAISLWVPAWGVAIGAGSALLVLGLKWGLLGRVAPGQHALWSCWCSRWDFLYVAWGAWARGPLTSLEGTLLLPWYLRAMGSKIGRRTLLGGGFAHVVDPDMLDIRDGATVNGLFQAHSFEDRVLKTDVVRIDPGASVGANSVLLYGAHLEAESTIAPHSVVMKRERIPERHFGEGSPVRVRRVNAE